MCPEFLPDADPWPSRRTSGGPNTAIAAGGGRAQAPAQCCIGGFSMFRGSWRLVLSHLYQAQRAKVASWGYNKCIFANVVCSRFQYWACVVLNCLVCGNSTCPHVNQYSYHRSTFKANSRVGFYVRAH